MDYPEFTIQKTKELPFLYNEKNTSLAQNPDSFKITGKHRHSNSTGNINNLHLNSSVINKSDGRFFPSSAKELNSGASSGSINFPSGYINVADNAEEEKDPFVDPTRPSDNNPYSCPLYSEVNSDLNRVSPWIVQSGEIPNPFYEQQNPDSCALAIESNSSYSKLCESVSALSFDQSTDRISPDDVFVDNSKLIEASLKSFSGQEHDSSDEVQSESSDEARSECSNEPLFDSTKDLITAEANRLIHLNLENPYFLLRFFKLAQKVRSDYQRQKLLIAMETMTSLEYSTFLKTKSQKKRDVPENEESSSNS